MHSMMFWPFLMLLTGVMVLAPTIEDSGHRSVMYWLIVPPLVAGILAACSHLGVS
jgi:hypothetical protein